jgi:hypothetical protein
VARTRASLTCSIWQDDDWRKLEPEAQRVYLLLLSQPKLTLAGCLDYMPARWATFATGGTEAEIQQAVDDLERGRFVSVDYTTQELVIRTFVRHDVGATANKNTVKGMWSAWAAVLSAQLRSLVLEHVPEELWADAPSEAVAMRDATPSEPLPEPLRNGRPNDGQNDRSDGRANLPLTSSSTSTATPARPDGGSTSAKPRNGSRSAPLGAGVFETWWEGYPRKVGKQEARTAFTRALKPPKPVTVELLTERLARQCAVWDSENRPEDKIPHAATWLRARRWEDDVLTKAPAAVNPINPRGERYT